jgi:peptidoglycan hydrolase-like protein with peptidoglycan-binding domain
MSLRQRAAVSNPARAVLAGAGVTVMLAASLGQTTMAAAAPAAAAPPAVAPAPVPLPAAPSGLPVALERLAAYVPAVSCDTKDKPGSLKLGALLRATYPGTTTGFSRACGSDGLSTTEHYDGRAVDWMTNVRTVEGRARGNAVVNWLTATDAKGNVAANARRLGVMYIIWNNRIWGAYNPAAGWRPYSTCATTTAASSDTACHRNHVHLSLSWEGAMGRTSWWTKSVAAQDFGPCRVPDLNWAPAYTAFRGTACPSYPKVYAAAGASTLYRSLVSYSGMTLRNGSTGPAVQAVQSAVGTGADGGFGPATVTAIQTFQRAHGLAADGLVGVGTWRALLKATAPVPPKTSGGPYDAYENTTLQSGSTGTAVVVLQKALGLSLVDGDFGPGTRSAVVAFQSAHRLTANGIVTAPVWRALGTAKPAPKPVPKPAPKPAAKGRYAAYEKVTLRLGSTGTAVKVLQKALGLRLVDGDFGPQTRSTVVAFETRRHLTANGIVTTPVWRALGTATPVAAAKPVARARYAAYVKVTLKLGSKGGAVKVLQQALGLRLVDGDFGPQTRSAVVAFERKRHLTANGVVSAVVWRALG